MGRILVVFALLGVGLFAACRYLLPERYAVNAPIRHMLGGSGTEAPDEAEVRSRMRVPEGFRIGLFATGLDNPRWLRPTPAGDLLVSLPRSGEVTLLEADRDGDGRSDGARVLLDGLDRPHGLDLHDGWLYVAEGSAVGRIRFDPARRATDGDFVRIVTGLPEGGNHWTRTVRIGPDGWMYVSVGSSCNVCEEQDPRRAAMLRYPADGGEGEIFADGLRNSVGFDWQPGTGALYATDNGRDLLGNDFPPCELNRVERGGFYGWPYANGNRVPDPDFGAEHPEEVARSIPPAHGFPAHNAPLGIEFLEAPGTPAAYRDSALVALHGSWNRQEKDGYEVVSLHWRDDGRIEEREFVTGFLVDEDVSGRPVDVAQARDGTIYVSDDYAGVVWRVTHGGAVASPASPRTGTAVVGEPEALDPARVAEGRRLWEAHECAGCHDPARAKPGVKPVPLAGLAARHRIASLTRYLAAPTPPMPVPPVDESGRQALAAYLLDAHGAP